MTLNASPRVELPPRLPTLSVVMPNYNHARYLEAGGSGFLLGDGRLDYARELIAELYYRLQVGRFLELSPDVQHIWNPGYNRDRGPATVLSLRLNARY